tara:strand:+ start:1019 stop:2053 length:1035 start_codon:yes stop_codon:yes gene_type:complete
MNNLPTITDRTFGIEMEFEGADIQAVAHKLNQVVACHFEGYTHRVTDYWKIVTDGSLPNYTTCGEIVSPILKGVEGVAELKKVCDALETIEGITVTRRCGLHIHLGVDDLTVRQIQTVYERYADYEAQIDLVMPRSRRGNANWCDSVVPNKNRIKRQPTKNRLAHAAGKYYKVNLNKLTTYGTIEFRHHSGTLNFTKIVNWLSFLQTFVERSVQLAGTRTVTLNKNRPYNMIRNILENNGYDVFYSRRYNGWKVEKEGGRYGSFVTILRNDELNDLYTGARESSLDRDAAYDYLCRNTRDNDLQKIWVLQRQAGNPNTEQDNGWLDGVDQTVKSYFAEREIELN